MNPVAILLTGYHGQFENLALLPLLIGAYLYVRKPDSPPVPVIWLLGTLALLIKHNTVFGMWMLFVYVFGVSRRAVVASMLSVAVFAFSFLPYLPEGNAGILQNVLLYSSMPGQFGLTLSCPPIPPR